MQGVWEVSLDLGLGTWRTRVRLEKKGPGQTISPRGLRLFLGLWKQSKARPHGAAGMALHGRGHLSSKPGGCVFLVKSDLSPGSWEVTTRISFLHTCSEVITYTHMFSPSPAGGFPRRLNELKSRRTHTDVLVHGWGRGKQPRSSKMPNPKHQPGESIAGRERQTDRKIIIQEQSCPVNLQEGTNPVATPTHTLQKITCVASSSAEKGSRDLWKGSG